MVVVQTLNRCLKFAHTFGTSCLKKSYYFVSFSNLFYITFGQMQIWKLPKIYIWSHFLWHLSQVQNGQEFSIFHQQLLQIQVGEECASSILLLIWNSKFLPMKLCNNRNIMKLHLFFFHFILEIIKNQIKYFHLRS